MAIDFSDYISILVKPGGNEGLHFTVPAAGLKTLPGKTLLHITLTTGTFADGTNDGGTGREDGYAPFKPRLEPGGTEFTLLIEKLQPAAPKPGEKAVVKGVAALALEEQKLAVLDASGATVATADAATVIVARVHFALLSLNAGESYQLTRRDPLVTLTSETDVDKLCVVYREDAPSGLDRIPGSHYVVFSVTQGGHVPGLELEFHVANPQNTAVFTRGVVNGQPGWTPFGGATTPTKSSVRLNSGGKTTFALVKKQ